MKHTFDTTILFGGDSGERRVSVASAQHVAVVVPSARLWFWAPNGQVFEVSHDDLLHHTQPFERDFIPTVAATYPSLLDAFNDASPADTFFLALHGGKGEDGTVQGWLEERRLYFSGSGAIASRLAFDKARAKDAVAARGVRVALSHTISPADTAAAEAAICDVLDNAARAVLKPVADGSSEGVSFVSDSTDISAALAAVRAYGAPFLVEAFVEGTELTIGVLDEDAAPRALPASEIRVERGRSFDYAGKYLGVGTREITPAEISQEDHAKVAAVAVASHQATGCRGYSRTDVILSTSGPVFLELNSLPGLTRASFIPQQLEAAGISMQAFVQGQLELARSRYLQSDDVAPHTHKGVAAGVV